MIYFYRRPRRRTTLSPRGVCDAVGGYLARRQDVRLPRGGGHPGGRLAHLPPPAVRQRYPRLADHRRPADSFRGGRRLRLAAPLLAELAAEAGVSPRTGRVGHPLPAGAPPR